MSSKLFQQIRVWAIRKPEKTALVVEGQRISWQDLFIKVDQLSLRLSASGVNANSLVVLEQNSRLNFILYLLALLKLKAVVAPISILTGSQERLRIHSILKPSVVITGNELAVDPLAEFNQEIPKLCPEGGFIRFTSGTTASSKGVLISSESALARVNAAAPGFSLVEDEVVASLMDLPFHFITSLFLFLKSGVTLVLPDSSSSTLLAELSAAEINVIYAAPFHYQNLVCNQASAKLSKLRLAISTSCNLTFEVATQFQSRFSTPISQSLGIIEVGLPISGGTRKNSLGCLLPDYEAKLSPDGILCLRGPGMFDAYLIPFQRKEEVLDEGWFRTGDLATISKNLEVSLIGRAVSSINLAGHKIFPEEIEEVLLSFPGVADVKVFARDHELAGQIIIANVCLKADHSIQASALRKYCRDKLGRLKTPQKIGFVDSIERTSSGKLRRCKEKFPVSIIGAGPAGATAGILFAKAGHPVKLYDCGQRPDLIVGESLLPAAVPLLQKLCLEDRVAARARLKPGAKIVLEDELPWSVNFASAGLEKPNYSYNILRSDFDKLLRDEAVKVGCELLPKKLKPRYDGSSDKVLIEGERNEGLVIDASGRSHALAKNIGIDLNRSAHRDMAVFAHYGLKDGFNLNGSIEIKVLRNEEQSFAWSWIIPLADRVSIGIVSNPEFFAGNAVQSFEQAISRYGLTHALPLTERTSRVAKYFNYKSFPERVVGSNWAMIGDAAGFVDPMFSSGVSLAMLGAEKVFQVVKGNSSSSSFAKSLQDYSDYIQSELNFWRCIVNSFYDGRFFSMIRVGSRQNNYLPNAFDQKEVHKIMARVVSGYGNLEPETLILFRSILNFCNAIEKKQLSGLNKSSHLAKSLILQRQVND